MPAIWASSERPLFVRTVWMDGVRHAVLSPDDPVVVNPRLRRRPRTSEEKRDLLAMRQRQMQETRLDRLNSCFMNLQVVVEKNFPDNGNEGSPSTRLVRRRSAPPCTRMCAEKAGSSLLEIYVNEIDDKSDEDDRESRRSLEKEERIVPTVGETAFARNPDVGRALYLRRGTFPAITECKQVEGSSDAYWNPLSERVLQWLDLSGRAHDYEPEVESDEGSRYENEDARGRWGSAVRRRRRRMRHLLRRRESSVSAERERRVAVQNYKLQKNCKLERVARATVENETKFARKRLSRINDATGREEARKKESTARGASSDVSKDRASSADESDPRNENDSQDEREDLLTVWTPPGRLQLHIVMPNFNSVVEKRASSLESLVRD